MFVEYKCKCDNCEKIGSSIFARIFYRKINGNIMYLCKDCWNKKTK